MPPTSARKTTYRQLRDKGSAARILVMRYRFIGDTLLTVPFLKLLREHLPEARIEMLVAPNSGELLEGCPYVDALIPWDTTRKHRYENSAENSRKQTFWQSLNFLESKQYDAVFVLKRSFSSAMLAFLAGIPHRVGFNTEGRGFLLTTRVPYSMTRHESQVFIDLLRSSGFPELEPQQGLLPDSPLPIAVWLAEEEQAVATQRMMPFQHKINIVLHLTSSNPAKQWPNQQAEKFLSWLLSNSNHQVHCLGATSDASVYELLRQTLAEHDRDRMTIWCGQLSLRQSQAILARMDLAVGVDSGTLHMARAANVPTVALFGPMDERKWQPPGAMVLNEPVACRPCNLKTPCHHEFQCMQMLSAEKVIAACQTLLNH